MKKNISHLPVLLVFAFLMPNLSNAQNDTNREKEGAGEKVGKFFKKVGDKAKEAVEDIQVATTTPSGSGGYSLLKANCREKYYSDEQYWLYPPFETKEQTKAKEAYAQIAPTSKEIQQMLIDALAAKNLEKAKKYLDAGASANAAIAMSKRVNGIYTHYPLEVAAAAGFKEGVDLLIQKGAKPEYSAALFIAVQVKNEEIFNYLLQKGADLYHLENGSKILMWRKCFDSGTAGLEYIEQYWWDRSSISDRPYSNVLRYAISLGKDYDGFIAKVIVSKLDISRLQYSVFDMNRLPLLVEAAKQNLQETCKALVEKGMPINGLNIYFPESCHTFEKYIYPVSPVLFAIKAGNNEFAKYFLSKGADLKFHSVPTKSGIDETVFGRSAANYVSIAVQLPNNLPLIKYLLSLGCPVNLPNEGVLKYSRPEYRDFLVDAGGK